MKQSTRAEEDLDEFEFRDEDYPECNPWSAIHAEPAIPILNDHDSSGPGALIKEIPTVTLDDDDDDDDSHYSTDDCSACPAEYPLVDFKVSEGHNLMSDINVGIRISNMQMKVFSQFGSLPENACVAEFGELDSNDRVQDSFPSTPNSGMEENNDSTVGQAHDQLAGDLDLDLIDTIPIHTDYVAYGGKYFPASVILVSKDTVKLKMSALEEESEACELEWKVDDILNIESQCSRLANLAKVRIRVLSKDSADAEIANKTSGAEVVEFLVPNWSVQKERIKSLRVRHNAVSGVGNNLEIYDGDADPFEDSESSSDPYIPIFEESFEEVVYPKGELDAVSVGKSDVDLLQPDVFLNDTIIDFYITYLKNGIPRERRNSFHFFSSFFFRKLADLDKNPSSVSDGKAAFQRVRRWTRKINIFEKDYVFIPVNYNLHWSLIILCHPGEVANFSDENIDEALKVPCILHMDSIRGTHAGLKDLLQSYLLEEWKERHKDTTEDISSKFTNLRFLSLELPQQENYTDCGLFLLHYAELFIDEAPLNFSPFRINNFDPFLKQDWFIPAEASLKRTHIQRLIYELLKTRSQESASPSRNNSLHSPTLPENNANENRVKIIFEKTSPQKTWNGASALYTEQVQDVDTGLHNLGSGMTEHLEQCQRYDEGASIGQLNFFMPPILEDDINEQLPHPNSGQPGLDPIVSIQTDPSSRDHTQIFQCNLEDASASASASSSESHSCHNSPKTNTIIHDCQKQLNDDQSNPFFLEDLIEEESEEDLDKTADGQLGFDSSEIPEKKNQNHDQSNPFFLEDLIEEESEEELDKTAGGQLGFDSSEIPEKKNQNHNHDQSNPFFLEDLIEEESSQEEIDKTADGQLGFDLAQGDAMEIPETPEKNENHDQVGPLLFSNCCLLEEVSDESREELDDNNDKKRARAPVRARVRARVVEDSPPPEQSRSTKRVRWFDEEEALLLLPKV